MIHFVSFFHTEFHSTWSPAARRRAAVCQADCAASPAASAPPHPRDVELASDLKCVLQAMLCPRIRCAQIWSLFSTWVPGNCELLKKPPQCRNSAPHGYYRVRMCTPELDPNGFGHRGSDAYPTLVKKNIYGFCVFGPNLNFWL